MVVVFRSLVYGMDSIISLQYYYRVFWDILKIVWLILMCRIIGGMTKGSEGWSCLLVSGRVGGQMGSQPQQETRDLILNMN